MKQTRRTITIITIAILLSALIAGCTDTSKKIDTTTINGEFEVIPTMKNTHEPGKVQMIEFFDFYCPHCYQLSKLLPLIENKYQDKLQITYIGYPLRPTSIPPIEAYIIAEKMGKGEEMKTAIFKAQWEEGKNIGDKNVLTKLAVSVGIDENTFREALKQGAKQQINKNIQLGNRYALRMTPTIIIDGNLKVEPTQGIQHMADNLDTIINSILQQDKQQNTQ